MLKKIDSRNTCKVIIFEWNRFENQVGFAHDDAFARQNSLCVIPDIDSVKAFSSVGVMGGSTAAQIEVSCHTLSQD
jgi:hypothetical protein